MVNGTITPPLTVQVEMLVPHSGTRDVLTALVDSAPSAKLNSSAHTAFNTPFSLFASLSYLVGCRVSGSAIKLQLSRSGFEGSSIRVTEDRTFPLPLQRFPSSSPIPPGPVFASDGHWNAEFWQRGGLFAILAVATLLGCSCLVWGESSQIKNLRSTIGSTTRSQDTFTSGYCWSHAALPTAAFGLLSASLHGYSVLQAPGLQLC
ncbi:hypothetical protein E2320_022559 [Naja naja]|nr:hypothetical protein E2320_022559 [Naja naja]